MVDELNEQITLLEADMRQFRRVSVGGEIDFYTSVLAAAFTKLYDFCLWALESDGDRGEHYWASAVLRGSTEDIIFLSALQKMSLADRNEMVRLRLVHEIENDIATQSEFFSEPRRFQSVLSPKPDAEQQLNNVLDSMNSIWRKYRMDGGRIGLGNMRNLADTASIVGFYDYFYALTSRMVHFSPRVLMRQGWGNYQDGVLHAEYSASNFKHYYTAYVQTYSCLLLREFIERFNGDLTMPSAFDAAAARIDEVCRKRRYPELVTYEEMNIEPPNPLLRAIELVLRSDDSLSQE